MINTYTAFSNTKLLTQGPLEDVVLKIKHAQKKSPEAQILVFSDLTGKQMDFDLSGSDKDVIERLQIYTAPDATPQAGPGRPKMGVVAREVSLLPRHWEWLSTQSGGASATIRRLIDSSRANPSQREIIKQAQERAHKFMTALAGNLPDFEEALRALYAKDKKKFAALVNDWPRDIREYSKKLADGAWE